MLVYRHPHETFKHIKKENNHSVFCLFKVSTAESIVKHFEGENADIVVCDGAPDVTGTKYILR